MMFDASAGAGFVAILLHCSSVSGQALWSDTSIQPFDSAPCERGNPIQVYNKGTTFYEVVQLDLDTGEYSNLFTLDGGFSSSDIINSVDLLLADGDYYAFGSVWRNSDEMFCRFDENNVVCFDTPLRSRSSVGAIIGNTFYYGRGKLEYWIKDINTDNPTFGDVSARIDNNLYESTVVDVTEILESGLEMIDDGDPNRNYLVGLGQAFEVFVMRLDSNGEYQDYIVIDTTTVDWNGQAPETGTSGFGAAYSYRDGRGGQRVFFTANEGWGLFELSLPIAVSDACWNDVTTNPDTHAACGSATAAVTWRTPSVRTSNNDGMNCHQNTLVLPGETPVPTRSPSYSPTQAPTRSPTPTPTAGVIPLPPAPTKSPSPAPTISPTTPTEAPTASPTGPTEEPTMSPSESPTAPPKELCGTAKMQITSSVAWDAALFNYIPSTTFFIFLALDHVDQNAEDGSQFKMMQVPLEAAKIDGQWDYGTTIRSTKMVVPDEADRCTPFIGAEGGVGRSVCTREQVSAWWDLGIDKSSDEYWGGNSWYLADIVVPTDCESDLEACVMTGTMQGHHINGRKEARGFLYTKVDDLIVGVAFDSGQYIMASCLLSDAMSSTTPPTIWRMRAISSAVCNPLGDCDAATVSSMWDGTNAAITDHNSLQSDFHLFDVDPDLEGGGCTSLTKSPTKSPTESPTEVPTGSPSTSPTGSPSTSPTGSPSTSPTESPSTSPTESPTNVPTTLPTPAPSESPTASPTSAPTGSPTTYCAACSNVCSASPTFSPTTLSGSTTNAPTAVMTRSPSLSPTSAPSEPTAQPTWGPTLRGSNLTKSVESDDNTTALVVPLVYVTDKSDNWSLCIPLIILALILGWCLGICCAVGRRKSKSSSPGDAAEDEKNVEAGKSFWDNMSTNSVAPDPTVLPGDISSSVGGLVSSSGGKVPGQNTETQTGDLKDGPDQQINSGPLQDEMSMPNLPVSDPLLKNEAGKLIHSSSMPKPHLKGPAASEVSPRYCDPNDTNLGGDGKSQLSRIYVGTPAGNAVPLNVRLTPNGDTVADVISQLKNQNVALHEPRLIFRSAPLANENQSLQSYGVQNDSLLQLEDDDDFQFEGRANALQKQHSDLGATIKSIESDLKSMLESKNEPGGNRSPLDKIICEADHLLRDSSDLSVPLEVRHRDLVRAHAETASKLEDLKGTKSNLSRAEASRQLSAIEMKTLENIAESQRIANDVGNMRGTRTGADQSCVGRCKSLQLELDKAREEMEKIKHSPGADLTCEGKCAKLQEELTEAKKELDELKSEMIRSSLSVKMPPPSVKMPPPLTAPLKQEAFQLSPKVDGIRGFKMNWDRNGNMEPLRRLEQAQFHVRNLDSKDLQKPEGPSLPYLESALKRAAILTSSPGDEVSDVWSYPVQERVAAIEPEEAKGVFDRVALARDIPVVKDEATLSSEYANVAETLEEFNQALINESNISHVVETITESRRAVLEIRRGNIDEIRSLNYPPPMVENILLSVMTIINDDSRKGGWKEMKRRMTKGSLFLREIFEFDATAMLPKHVKDTKKIFASHPEDFNPEVITQKGSAALPPLFKWVQTMIYFHDTFKDVQPGLKEHILERVRAAYADFVEDVSLERAISSRRHSRTSSFASSIGSSRASSRSNSRPNSASEHSSQMRKKSLKERANLGRKSITYERDEYGRIIKDENNSIESILATSH